MYCSVGLHLVYLSNHCMYIDILAVVGVPICNGCFCQDTLHEVYMCCLMETLLTCECCPKLLQTWTPLVEATTSITFLFLLTVDVMWRYLSCLSTAYIQCTTNHFQNWYIPMSWCQTRETTVPAGPKQRRGLVWETCFINEKNELKFEKLSGLTTVGALVIVGSRKRLTAFLKYISLVSKLFYYIPLHHTQESVCTIVMAQQCDVKSSVMQNFC